MPCVAVSTAIQEDCAKQEGGDMSRAKEDFVEEVMTELYLEG